MNRRTRKKQQEEVNEMNVTDCEYAFLLGSRRKKQSMVSSDYMQPCLGTKSFRPRYLVDYTSYNQTYTPKTYCTHRPYEQVAKSRDTSRETTEIQIHDRCKLDVVFTNH